VNRRRTRVGVVAFAVSATLVSFADPALGDQFRDRQWHLRALEVAEANAITKGDGVVVAVLDTGVSPHVDLRRNLVPGRSVISSGQANGQGDPNGHGTAMASLIAAHGRNSDAGVVGIAPEAKIVPVRFADKQGRTDSIDAARAIEAAAKLGAKIINFSDAVAPSIALQTAMEVTNRNDVLVIAAAGNRSQDVVSAYPAAMPGVLAVGASDRSGEPADFSVSAKYVQLCAPGVDIEAAYGNNRYLKGWGTSQATAIVSGAAALIRAKFPDISAQEVIHRLTATATDNGPPGRDDKCGYGVLNIVKALTAAVPPLKTASSAVPTASAAPSTTAAAVPQSDKASSSAPAIVAGLVVAALVGALAAFLVVRRRRSPTTR
jgi:type VII secretion-associated serine protease mycosin